MHLHLNRSADDHAAPLRRARRGTSVLEAFLVLNLVLLCLIFPAMEFGYFFYVKHTFQGAAREGARAAIVQSSTNAAVTNAIAYHMGAANLQSCGYTVTIQNASTEAVIPDVGTVPAGTPIRVSVQVAWGSVGIRMLGVSPIGSGKLVVGRCVMRKE